MSSLIGVRMFIFTSLWWAGQAPMPTTSELVTLSSLGDFVSGKADGDVQQHLRGHLKFKNTELHFSYHMPLGAPYKTSGVFKYNLDGETNDGRITQSVLKGVGGVWAAKFTLVDASGPHEMTVTLSPTGACPNFDNHSCVKYTATSAVIQ